MPIPGAAIASNSDSASGVRDAEVGGRSEERQALTEMILQGKDQLTVVAGGAGVGKSRLVHEVCESIAEHFEGGVWYASLSDSLRAPTLAWGVLQAFGLRPGGHDSAEQTVLTILSNRKPLLLVLDGFERYFSTCQPILREWMRRAPHSRFLITAREDLDYGFGTTFKLGSLKSPPHPAPGEQVTDAYVEALATYPAVQALIARAQLVKPEKALTAENARAIAVICSVMEGLPLALEILASRVSEIEFNRIASQVEQKRAFMNTVRPDLSRQERVMRTAIEWSYEFLPEWAKVALEQTTVFETPFDLESATQVVSFPDMGGEAIIGRALEGLHRMRLLQSFDSPEGQKYALHDAVREFVRERWLERSSPDEDRDLRDRYAVQTLRMIEKLGTAYGTLEMLALQADSQLEAHTMLKLQDRWYGTKDANTRLITLSSQLKTALAIGLMNAAEYEEAQTLALEAADDARDKREYHALGAALQQAADVAENRGEYDVALHSIEAAQEAYTLVNNQAALASLNLAQGRIHTKRGEFRSALQEFASAKSLYREINLHQGEADAQVEAGKLLRLRGELRAALRCFETALEIYQNEGNAKRIAVAATLRAAVMALMGRFEDARECFEDAILLSTEHGDRLATAEHTLAYGRVLRLQGRYAEAQRYIAEAEEVFNELGVKSSVALAQAESGLLNSELGFYRDALEQQRASLRMNRELSQRHAVMQCQLNLGLILVEMTRYDDAARPLRRASLLARGFEDMASHAEAEVHLALLQMYGGDLKLAKREEQIARKIAEGLDDVFVRSLVLGVCGEIQLANDELEMAVELLERSTSLARDHGFISKIPCFRVLVALAEAYWRQNREAECRAAMNEATQLSTVGGIMGNRRLTRSREFLQRLQLLRQAMASQRMPN